MKSHPASTAATASSREPTCQHAFAVNDLNQRGIGIAIEEIHDLGALRCDSNISF
jgi:hypothetical protein